MNNHYNTGNGHHYSNNNYHHNKFNHSYSKYNNSNGYGGPTSGTSSQQHQSSSTYPSYKRRPFSTRNYNTYGEGGGGGGGGHYRTNYRYRVNNYENGKIVTNGQEEGSQEKKESSFNEGLFEIIFS